MAVPRAVVLGCGPTEIKFMTDDVHLFWRAFDLFIQDTTLNPFVDYYNSGSVAIKDILRFEPNAAQTMKNTVRRELSHYLAVRHNIQLIDRYKSEVDAYFKNFRAIYSHAEFPPVHFVVGKLNSGGTVTQNGIIIGLEMFGDSLAVKNRPQTIRMEDLPVVIATCLVFYNQKPAHTGYTLLRQAIVHGAADFLATLIVGEKKQLILERPHYKYGDAHEETLVREFLRQRDETDFSGWFYYGNPSGRPADLAFWIGYKITESYYTSARDKTKAIDDILKINDFEKFLLLSGYAEPFRN